MKYLLFCVFCILFTNVSFAQSDIDQIEAAIQRYIDGTSYNDPEQILSAFYEEADLFLSREGYEIWLMPVQEYAGRFEQGERGQHNGRTGKIIGIERYNDIALAKAEIELPSSDLLFIDVFILKRLSGEWKIISKAATRIE